MSNSSSHSEEERVPVRQPRRSYRHMITEAIYTDKKWNKGSSRSTIKHYILDHYDVSESEVKEKLTSTLADMLEPSDGGQPCLIEIDNNYKLTADWRVAWRKKYASASTTRTKKKDKHAPKGPRNAYNFYVQMNHQKKCKEYPDLLPKQITKLLAREWNKLSSKKKLKYEDLAEKDRKRFNRDLEKYEDKKYEKNKAHYNNSSSGSGSESVSKTRSSKKKKRSSSKSHKKYRSSSSEDDDHRQVKKKRSSTSEAKRYQSDEKF